jgi:hypothetical protein
MRKGRFVLPFWIFQNYTLESIPFHVVEPASRQPIDGFRLTAGVEEGLVGSNGAVAWENQGGSPSKLLLPGGLAADTSVNDENERTIHGVERALHLHLASCCIGRDHQPCILHHAASLKV